MTRDELVEKLKSQLDVLNQQADKVEQKMASAKDSAEGELSQRLEELKAKRAEARHSLEELSNAGHDRWEAVKKKAEDTTKAFQHSVNYFLSQVK